VEFAILADCAMVPVPAAHLLSNHYNLTRDQYYRELDKASKSGGDTLGFLSYAITGFVDGIREAISMVREQQIHVAWVNYVHEQLLPVSVESVHPFRLNPYTRFGVFVHPG
jgi:hypothetical protein